MSMSGHQVMAQILSVIHTLCLSVREACPFKYLQILKKKNYKYLQSLRSPTSLNECRRALRRTMNCMICLSSSAGIIFRLVLVRNTRPRHIVLLDFCCQLVPIAIFVQMFLIVILLSCYPAIFSQCHPNVSHSYLVHPRCPPPILVINFKWGTTLRWMKEILWYISKYIVLRK